MKKRDENISRFPGKLEKRGLSNIVGTVLIVLLALAAIGIIWMFLSPVFTETGGKVNVQTQLTGVGYEIISQSLVINGVTKAVQGKVEKKAGSAEGGGFVVVLVDDTGARERFDDYAELDIEPLARTDITLAYTLTGTITKVEVYASVVDNTGNIVVGGSIADSYIVPVGGTPQCVVSLDCDDGMANTNDVCTAGVCGYTYTSFRAFVSSTSYLGNFGGLTAADGLCQSLANTAGIGGDWMAWLSDGTTSAASRLAQSSAPYNTIPFERTDGMPIASGWADLVDGTPHTNPIRYDENGNNLPSSAVWTGTDSTGAISPPNCLDWTSSLNSDLATFGLSGATDSTWTKGTLNGNCDGNPVRIYCFEQPI